MDRLRMVASSHIQQRERMGDIHCKPLGKVVVIYTLDPLCDKTVEPCRWHMLLMMWSILVAKSLSTFHGISLCSAVNIPYGMTSVLYWTRQGCPGIKIRRVESDCCSWTLPWNLVRNNSCVLCNYYIPGNLWIMNKSSLFLAFATERLFRRYCIHMRYSNLYYTPTRIAYIWNNVPIHVIWWRQKLIEFVAKICEHIVALWIQA